ncbi:MAG: WD40/YVTN/BNR-like repeat-containing protein [Flavobacteriia bacterium]
MNKSLFACSVTFLFILSSFGQKKDTKAEVKPLFDASTISGLSFRNVGPALTSGRIADIAVHPKNHDKWYIAAASAGVWITENHGTTFSPIFENYGSFSIACVELAPSNPNTIWVGTGENNNQRSVAYGDGVYKSLDGGKSFTNMGLSKSEHIGNIIIHPQDENTIWVAAYGPVWSSGGERGVYKSTDGGKTWNRTLFISEETGVSEIAIDPENPNILYASAHQRRRHEWTYIGGGPESAIYKSTDGGTTWREINAGLPKNQMGRIGLAVSSVDPNYVYAIVEGKEDKGGFFRSTNKGESWTKMSGFNTSGNYYQEIMCDPYNRDKVFAMDTYMHHTEDGGKNFKPTGEHQKHVDNHAIWIDPSNTNHWIAGCDGGIYETYNHAQQWRYYSNLPIIQFYKVATDNDYPFYNIYGGTQDNNSMGGPSQTNNVGGIMNEDWFITNGGDGFESACDPTDPNITYAQAQYGFLVRHDKASGEKVYIQPLPQKGEAAYRWNWDSPLLVSPHDHKTLYFAANKVFKTTNRGDDWNVISPDLTQQIDRNKLKVMGQVWSIDAIMKNASTTIYGNIVALDESPKKKGLLYAGTDDGLIQSSEDDGQTWKKQMVFPGIPANTRVNMLTASQHNENEVFAVFNNHRSGDFKPYILKSSDKGKTWVSISGNLPQRGSVYCLKQDHLDPNLLFVGTEFGAYFTNDGGKIWTKLSGLPTIAVYDLDIQKRENDLVAASFGRGFYVLDNYSPLRQLNKTNIDKKAHLFPVSDALLYVQADPLGLEGTGFQGANLWSTPNPEVGATFTLYMKDEFKSLKSIRQEKETSLEKDKKDVSYPTFEELRNEKLEETAQIIFVVSTSKNKEIRRLVSPVTAGISRITWNLRTEATNPIEAGNYANKNNGFLVQPGTYFVQVLKINNGTIDTLTEKSAFNVVGLNNQTLMAVDPSALDQFRYELMEFNRKLNAASRKLEERSEQIKSMATALVIFPNTSIILLKEIQALQLQKEACRTLLYGDEIKKSKEFESLPGIMERFGLIQYMVSDNTTGVSNNHRQQFALIQDEFLQFQLQLNELDKKSNAILNQLDKEGIPYIRQ